VVDKLIALGVISLADLDEVGTEPLISELKIEPDLAQKLTAAAAKEAERLAEESKPEETQEEVAQKAEAGDGK
jgi:hypothetical protein